MITGLQRHRPAAVRQRHGAALHARRTRSSPPTAATSRPASSPSTTRSSCSTSQRRPSTPTSACRCRPTLPTTGRRATTAAAAPSPASGREEFAHYLGWLIGDGSTSGTTVTTIYGSVEDRHEILPRHAEFVEWVNGDRPLKVSEQANGTAQLRLAAAPSSASSRRSASARSRAREVGAVVDRAGAGRDGGRVPPGPLRRRRVRRRSTAARAATSGSARRRPSSCVVSRSCSPPSASSAGSTRRRTR